MTNQPRDPSKQAPPGPPGPPGPVLAALRVILRPLLRLCVEFGITLPLLTELIKEGYVEIAQRNFQVDSKRLTDSRINLLTGVHRKDIRRLRQQSNPAQSIPPMVSLGAQVVATWLDEEPFAGESGPNLLPMRAQAGEASFESLVARVVRQDVRARVVLEEFVRLGIVEVDDDELIALKTAGFVPTGGWPEKAHYLGVNVRDHLAAAVRNLIESPSPHFERSASYHGLSAADVEELDELSRELGNELLKRVNRRARALQNRSKHKSENTHRIRTGLYVWVEDNANTDAVEDNADS